MSTSLSKLKNLPFWQNLSLSEQEIMSNCVQIRRYQKDELIYSHDHECLGLIKVLSGEIRTFMLSDEGREIVLYRLKAGDTDVLSASCVVNQITFETQMVAVSCGSQPPCAERKQNVIISRWAYESPVLV